MTGDDGLERLVDRALKGSSDRAAPATLVPRVFEELAARSALPWYHRTFFHWPLAARAAFIAGCAALIAGTARGHVDTLVGGVSVPGFGAARSIAFALRDVGRQLTDAIPISWWYGGLGLGAGLYVGLFGLAAVGYRLLYLKPSTR